LEAGQWKSYLPDGPSSNQIYAISFTDQGGVIMVSGGGGGEAGLSYWDGDRWQIWVSPNQRERIFYYSCRSVAADIDGGFWVGSYGGGIARFLPDGSYQTYDYSLETGRRLVGYSSDPRVADYVLSPEVGLDRSGNLWVLNRGAFNGQVLVCIPRDFIQDPAPDKAWRYFQRSLFNNYDRLEILAIDGRGRKWMGSSDPESLPAQGVYVFDENGTMDNAGDDRSWGPIGGLNSKQVLDITWDPAGYIWVGSIDGAYYIRADVDEPEREQFTILYPLRQQGVYSIAVDAAGNILQRNDTAAAPATASAWLPVNGCKVIHRSMCL
jgi:ligand-binding sensor domain-containing protein